jgi:hypothetical protein
LPLLVSGAFVTPFLVLPFYSVPYFDDFCKAALSFDGVPQSNALTVTWLYYTRWSPRWLTTLMQSFLMHNVDIISWYGWLLLAVIGITFASLTYFIKTFWGLSRKQSLSFAAIFYTTWMASITVPSEALFWLTGATEYYLPLSALLVLACALRRFRPIIRDYILVSLLSFAIPALHEIAGVFLFALVLGGAIAAYAKKLPARRWKLSLAACLPSLVLFFISPGNARRAAYEHRQYGDFFHAPHWVAHSLYHGLAWLSSPALLAALFYIVVSFNRKEGNGRLDPPKWLAAASLGMMVFVLCEAALIEMAGGTWLAERAVAWFQFVFWLLFIAVVTGGMRERDGIVFSPRTQRGALVVFAITLFTSSNFRSALHDLRGPAQAWRRAYVADFRQGGDVVSFPAVTQHPILAIPQGLTNDPSCATNRCLSNFMKVKSVVVTGTDESCPVADKTSPSSK